MNYIVSLSQTTRHKNLEKLASDFNFGEEHTDGIEAGASWLELDVELFVAVPVLSDLRRY